jgi:hypothetical protein
MERHIKIIKQLAESTQSDFRDDQLEKIGIHYNDREDLVRKGFLKIEGVYPERVYFLTDSAYMLISANQHEKIAEKGFSWQKLGIAASIILSIIAILISVFK